MPLLLALLYTKRYVGITLTYCMWDNRILLFIIYLYDIRTKVNYSIINMGYLFYTLLHKIVDNFQNNTKTLLPSKE